MALKGKSGNAKVIWVHPLGTMDIYTKFIGNPSNSLGISLKTINVNLIFVLEEKSGDHTLVGFLVLGP